MGKTIGIILALQDKCSPNIKKVADKIGITEKEAKKLNAQIGKLSKEMSGNFNKAFKAVGIGIGSVVGSVGLMANKAIEAGDRIDKMSQKIGMSRSSFQMWDYILSQSGVNIEQMQVGMKTLSQQMVASTKRGSDSEKMFKKLGVSVKDSKGHFKSQEQAFEELILALQRMPDGIEKADMAQKLFGKTGSELRPLLNGVRGNIDELKVKYKELGLEMSDDAVNSAVKLQDTIETIQRTFSSFGNSLMAEFMPTIQELADELIVHLPEIKSALTPVINGLTNAFKFLMEHMNGIIVVGSAVLGTIVAFKTISTVIAIIKTLHTVIEIVTLAQGVWNAMMIANPIGLIATGIGLLIAGIVLLIQNWDKVTNAVKKAIDAMKKFVGIKSNSNVKGTPEVEIKKNALGTAFSTGGTTLVGEHGAELVQMPRGANVIPANQTQKILTTNNNNGINIQVVIQGNMVGNQEFLNEIGNVFARKLQVAMAVK